MVPGDLETRLDLRLATLARRIVKLERVMGRALVEGFDEIQALVARHAALAERWNGLDHAATPKSQEQAEIAALVDELAGAVEDAMIRIYLGFQTEPADSADEIPPIAAARRG